jgi:hypothetical protein
MNDDDDGGEKLADVLNAQKRRKRIDPRLVTAAATGIGSAALVAALLYANKGRKKKPESE